MAMLAVRFRRLKLSSTILASMNLRRAVLVAWAGYVRCKLLTRAVEQRRSSLLQAAVLRTLKSRVARRKAGQAQLRRAEQQARLACCRRGVRALARRVVRRRRLRVAARRVGSRVVLRKAMAVWGARAAEKEASELRQASMRRAVARWRRRAARSRAQRLQGAGAEAGLRRWRVRVRWNQWRAVVEARLLARERGRQSALGYHRRLLERGLAEWRLASMAHARLQCWHALAGRAFASRATRAGWDGMRLWQARRRMQEETAAIALELWRLARVGRALARWRVRARTLRELGRALEVADAHHARVTRRRALGGWHAWAGRRGVEQARASDAVSVLEVWRRGWAMERWRRRARGLGEEELGCTRRRAWMELWRGRRAMGDWAMRARATRAQRQRLEFASLVLRIKARRRALRWWRRQAALAKACRVEHDIADEFAGALLQHRARVALGEWRAQALLSRAEEGDSRRRLEG